MQTADIPLNHVERIDRFKTMHKTELLPWLTKEQEFWSKIHFTLKKSLNNDEFPDENIGLVSQYLKAIDVALQGLTDTRNIILIQSNTPLPFHDESNFNPKRIIEFAKNGQLSIVLYIFETTLQNQYTTYIKSYTADLKLIEDSFKNHLTNTENSFTNNFNEISASSDEKIKEFVENTKNQLEEKCKESVEEIIAITKGTSSEILAEEPVKYWKERELNHNKKAKTYLKIIIGAAILFILTIISLVFTVYSKSELHEIAGVQIPIPTDKYGIALLILTTTSAIWFIRVLVKLMMTNLALEIEALERSTMIRTFIAMEKTKVEKSDDVRMLFYSTLFKPTNNNLTDDSTSPEYIRLIEAMLQKK
ncbi:DUF6161 domain-containing protein [Pseudomonas veronii]|jgi:hypothetical protein|uniref:DUF6161 domain-containing protein n=1 Tax=Pseudomonas veronii TaxID=76761 RepID=UPI000F843910|nr:DUF6161 domain-containing protein [Pseudomonas veronii]RTY63914.1 hypothetical protein EKA83_32605 [Pseudomonas veronii]